MEELIAVLSVWAAATTGLPEALYPPTVRQFEQQHVGAMYSGRYGLPGNGDILAVYARMVDTIVLRDDWNMHDPVELSVLVHELVHHLQNHADETYPCPQAREAPAFAAQQQWLDMFGEDLESAFGIDKLTLTLRTQCLYDFTPRESP